MGRRYWVMRTDRTRMEYLSGELRAGRMRQGWGNREDLDLELLVGLVRSGEPLSGEQRAAWRNRRLLPSEPDGVRRDDIVLLPNLPEYGRWFVAEVADDQYRYEFPSEMGDYGHVRNVRLLNPDSPVNPHDGAVSARLRSTMRVGWRLWNIDHHGADVRTLLEALQDGRPVDQPQGADGEGPSGEAAKVAENLWGDKLYQRRAREALPLLVRQAEAGERVYYSDLAEELGMPLARNLNYPLGCIGEALENLSEQWGERIPPLQCLVVNRATELPGEGIGWFIENKEDFWKLPRALQRQQLSVALADVYAYPAWRHVLRELGIREPVPFDQRRLDAASRMRAGGEGEHHRRLKEHVAAHPELLGVRSAVETYTELPLPSGDVVDVLFKTPNCWHVAEVKPAGSGEPDLLRGLFQCVKYGAVIEGWQATQLLPPSARAVLVLEGRLPEGLLLVKNVLGVEVVEGVKPD